MVKKIVIHGASGLRNSGDEAILQAIIQQCPTEWQITVISFDPVYTQKIHPAVTAVRMGDSSCLRAIEQCDGFILGGGGLIQDETSVYNVSRWLKYLKYAIKMGKPTFLYANSIGPLHFGFNCWMAKSVLKKVDAITLRDEISYKELEKLHVADKASVTADPVFSLNVPEVDMQILNQYGLGEKEYVAICVRHWFDTIPWLPVSICTKFRLRRKTDMLRYKNYIRTITTQ